VLVSGRGELTSPPERLSVDGGPWVGVSAWAGPWLSVERWWRPTQRRAAWLQVVLQTEAAHLLRSARGEWRFAATYD
jgi:protein ImuB